MNVRLYFWQRASAAVMAPLVIVHLALIFYATRKGLTAADILSRTRGSFVWAAFYGAFVIAAALHASIGLRQILREWARARGWALDALSWGIGLALLALGLRAVAGVVLA